MEHQSHGSPSFINIAVLLLFAIVIAVASSVTAYFFLSSKSSEQPAVQPPVISPVQTNNLTNVLPTVPPATTGSQTTTANETANWKVYTNTKVGFTIKYPERYQKPVLPSGIGDSPTIYADGAEDDAIIIFTGIDPDDNSFSLIVSPFNGDVTEFVENQKKTIYSFTEKPYVQQGTDLIVDGRKTLRYFTQSNAIRVYFTGKNHSFILVTDRSSDKEIKQILSTFKFLE